MIVNRRIALNMTTAPDYNPPGPQRQSFAGTPFASPSTASTTGTGPAPSLHPTPFPPAPRRPKPTTTTDLAPSALRARGEVQKTLSYTPEAAEQSLIDALDSAGPKATAAVEAEDFAGAMAALASLRAPIDRFFEEVTVNDADPAKRRARLELLARFRDAVHAVADFSRIEG